MKKTNKNYIWAKLFVQRLEKLGVKDVCISPGSRNTPLTIAFSESKKIKQHVFVDERSSAFFALGISKITKLPTIIVTTSGTATAEIYPAIIEAYQTRSPLIICTADRPEYLRNSGANQTINQDDIYRNHVRKFWDLRIPNLTKTRLSTLQRITDEAFYISSTINKGPVHLNFPFEKPLEPESLNAEYDINLFNEILDKEIKFKKRKYSGISKKYLLQISKSKKILFSVGIIEEDDEKEIVKFCKKNNIPILCDGLTSSRFQKNENVISFGSLIFNELEKTKYEPDCIIHFGKAPTTAKAEQFFKNTSAKKILINEFGDKHDSTLTFKNPIKISVEKFLSEFKNEELTISNKEYFKILRELELQVKRIDEKAYSNEFTLETNVVKSIIGTLPNNCNLFIGNSTVTREVDFVTRNIQKEIRVFANRGASGIDGIISTAAGVARKSKKNTFLLIGDLSFFYDLTFLQYLNNYSINLKIILINNDGGGIFNLLPIAEHKKGFEKYFTTSLGLNIKDLVLAFGGKYYEINSKKDLTKINEEIPQFTVYEIKTDSKKSKKFRKKFFDKFRNEIKLS